MTPPLYGWRCPSKTWSLLLQTVLFLFYLACCTRRKESKAILEEVGGWIEELDSLSFSLLVFILSPPIPSTLSMSCLAFFFLVPLPDRPFHHFCPSTSVDWQAFCSSETTMIDGSWGIKLCKSDGGIFCFYFSQKAAESAISVGQRRQIYRHGNRQTDRQSNRQTYLLSHGFTWSSSCFNPGLTETQLVSTPTHVRTYLRSKNENSGAGRKNCLN